MINPFVGAHLQRVVAVDLLGEVEGVRFQSIELTLKRTFRLGVVDGLLVASVTL